MSARKAAPGLTAPPRPPTTLPPAVPRPRPNSRPRPAAPPPGTRTHLEAPAGALADWSQRAGAVLIDSVIGFVMTALMYAIAIGLIVAGNGAAAAGFVLLFATYLLAPLVSFAFYVWQLCRVGEHNGQTIGKRAFGIRIVRADGQPVGFGTVLMRHSVIGLFYLLTVGIGILVDYLWPLRDENNQSLHDKLANTYVVRADGATSPASGAAFAPGPAATRARPGTMWPPSPNQPVNLAPEGSFDPYDDRASHTPASAAGPVHCRRCGQATEIGARFCEDCGEPAAPTSGGPADDWRGRSEPWERAASRQARERIEELTPGATELASQLAEQFRTPAVAAAVAAGALAAAIVFGIGVVLAVVLPHDWLIGRVGFGKGIVTGGFAQMLNFLQAGFSVDTASSKWGPALFLAFPIGACAFSAATQTGRTVGLKPSLRMASGAGVGLVFGLLMLIPAVSAGGLLGEDGGPLPTPNIGAAVLLGMLWGATGGLLGTWWVLRRELGPAFLAPLLPPDSRQIGRTAFVILRPLAVALATMSIAATLVWSVDTVVTGGRTGDGLGGGSLVGGVVDSVAYSVEHGLQWTELGGLAQFKSGGSPVPISDPSLVQANGSGAFRIFDYGKAIPAYTFIPLLLFVIAIPLLLALAAGFGAARVQRAPTPLIGAAWGLLVGPVWAITLAIVGALIAKPEFFGDAVGGSVFGMFLLVGGLAGAVGGFLASQGVARPVPPVASRLA
ncbi:MAG TPA: RDD family protein [Solirubrobacteraceae bacterium]